MVEDHPNCPFADLWGVSILLALFCLLMTPSSQRMESPAIPGRFNLFYTMASIAAHNLTRELQMQTKPRSRKTNPKRAALWAFEKLETMRNKLIRRAGRVHYPDGRLTLTMSHNRAVQEELERVMDGLRKAA